MKNLYLFLVICFFAQMAMAQDVQYEKVESLPLHEAKINAGLLFLGVFDVTYENLLNDESSIGVSVGFPFDDFISWDLNFAATGFYRFYFGEGYADGFFAEGFAMYNNYEENLRKSDSEGNSIRVNEDVNDFALGIGGGYKIVSKGGVTFEANIGIGRNFFNYDLPGRTYNFVPRGGIHVGYRF